MRIFWTAAFATTSNGPRPINTSRDLVGSPTKSQHALRSVGGITVNLCIHKLFFFLSILRLQRLKVGETLQRVSTSVYSAIPGPTELDNTLIAMTQL